MHSGRGEEASDHTYRLLPIPQEPQGPAAGEAREGVVLPAAGGQWDQPAQVVQPAPGQPWGAPPQGADQGAERTQLITPYGASDADRTQLLPPQGRQPQSEGTQVLPPYQAEPAAPARQPQSEGTQVLPPYQAEPAAPARQPLPPEQSFGAPVPSPPPTPPAPPGQPPMPAAPPFAIRPGTPADNPAPQPGEGAAAATQQLPRYEEPAVQQQPGQQPPAEDDYDYLYRRDGQAAPPQPAAGYTAPQTPVYGAPSSGYAAPQQGYDNGYGNDNGYGGGYGGGNGYDPQAAAPAPGRGGTGRGKLSPPALIGIIVAACAVVGLAVGAAFSGGGSDSQNAGASSSAGASTAPAAAGDAAGQAKELDALLADSNNSRSQVINAVQTIKTCGNLGQAATDLRSAAGQRGDLVTRLGKLNVGQLPNHDQLVTRLTTAWQASAAADEHYAAWAEHSGCKKGHPKPTAEFLQGNRSSGEATMAKKAAADLWNPIARQYGLTERQFSDL